MYRTLVRIALVAGLTLSAAFLTTAPRAKADHQRSHGDTSASQAVVAKRTLTLDGALQAIDAAKAEARKNNAGGVVAVVDDGGNLIAVQRIDNTFAAGANISIGKARTAAIFKKPTKFFEDVIAKGRTAMTALPDFTPLQGGVPIIIEGQVVGAVGVSGASSAQQDEEFAIAAANAVTSSSLAGSAMPAPGMLPGDEDATFIMSADVSAAFAKGMPLIENAEFKVHASRRDKPGQAEVHEHETDIIHVLEGSAVLVTGGTLVGGKMTADGEIRGAAIEGGDTRTIARGDLVIVPNGVPHWFKELKGNGPLLYYVVKTIRHG
jgi:uncharacterized protein GlcG (DUF336 family)/mannose-6-phosphate isomerase-like protein (cupin superfamily)